MVRAEYLRRRTGRSGSIDAPSPIPKGNKNTSRQICAAIIHSKCHQTRSTQNPLVFMQINPEKGIQVI